MHVTDHEKSSQAADIPRSHQYSPMSHHTQFPTCCSCKPPLCLRLEYYLLLVVVDQLCKELHIKYTGLFSIIIILYIGYTFTCHTSIIRVKTVVGEDWSASTLQ